MLLLSYNISDLIEDESSEVTKQTTRKFENIEPNHHMYEISFESVSVRNVVRCYQWLVNRQLKIILTNVILSGLNITLGRVRNTFIMIFD